MKKNIFLFLIIALPILSFANTDSLTSKSRISLLTCGSGNEIYAHFGHSAIWVYDDSLNIDKVYNYGTFDFNDPNFALKFARGKLLYKLSVSNINRFMAEYVHTNRTVREQLLNLNKEQKQEVYAFLERNCLPENRYYLYDFYFDNCATRIRDVFENILKEKLQLNYTAYVDEEKTYRELLKPDLQTVPWLTLGIDLILGIPTDKIAPEKDFTFLPDYMEISFENGIVKTDSTSDPFVVGKRTLFEAKPQIITSNGLLNSPKVVLWGIFGIFAIIFFFLHRAKRKLGILDFILWLIPTILGFLLLGLMLYSDHSVVQKNMNIIWANPLHFFFIWGLLRKNSPRWVKIYFKYYGFILIIFIFSMSFLPQYFNPAIIPILIILLLSSMRIQNTY